MFEFPHLCVEILVHNCIIHSHEFHATTLKQVIRSLELEWRVVSHSFYSRT